MSSKNCQRCKETLELSSLNFYKDKRKSDGFENTCKRCRYANRFKNKEILKNSEKENISQKLCKRCNITHNIDNFYKDKTKKSGYSQYCKCCSKKCKYTKNKSKEVLLENVEIYYKKCSKCKVEKICSLFKINNKAIDKRYNICIDCQPKSQLTIEKQREYWRKYEINNKEKRREKWKKDGQNLNRKIKSRLSVRLREICKSFRQNKNSKTYDYLGCSREFFLKWIEFQFDSNINWENFKDWHIDHVVPCSSFNLQNEEDLYKCFNWTNLRPVLANENLMKGKKIDDLLITYHLEKACIFKNSWLSINNVNCGDSVKI